MKFQTNCLFTIKHVTTLRAKRAKLLLCDFLKQTNNYYLHRFRPLCCLKIRLSCSKPLLFLSAAYKTVRLLCSSSNQGSFVTTRWSLLGLRRSVEAWFRNRSALAGLALLCIAESRTLLCRAELFELFQQPRACSAPLPAAAAADRRLVTTGAEREQEQTINFA